MNSSTPPLAGLCAATLLALTGCDQPPPTTPDPDASSIETFAKSGESGAFADDALSGDDAPAGTDAATDAVALESGSESPSDTRPRSAAALPADTLGDAATLDALVAESDIPYPVYPNGEKYRVGGENGLRIVLFETTDSFEDVDAYYGDRADDAGMPRLVAMEDYVRYSRETADDDPWATDRPGIVIHRFDDDGERDAVGAGPKARTNIIMSF